MNDVGVCQAMGTLGSLTWCLEEQQTPVRWGTQEEKQVGVEYKDGEKRCLKKQWDEFVPGGVQVGQKGPASHQLTLSPPQTSAEPWSLHHDVASPHLLLPAGICR